MNFQRMKSVLTSRYISIHTREELLGSRLTHPDIRIRGLDNFKTAAKETRDNRNVITAESDRNLMDC